MNAVQDKSLAVGDIVVFDAIPSFAAVFSGTVPRPRYYERATGQAWPHVRHFWRWALRTAAVKKMCDTLKLDANTRRPSFPQCGRRWQPWQDPGEVDKSQQFDSATERLRTALGVSDAGVLFTEPASMLPGSRVSDYPDRAQGWYMVAVNEDGTRCAVLRVR